MISIRDLWQKAFINLDLYITIIVVVTLVMLNLFNVANPRYVSSATLAILGVIALRLSSLQNQPRREAFLYEYPDIEAELRKAKDIWISGQSLRRTATAYHGLFQKKLKEGSCIRILLVDPLGVGSELGAKRISRMPEVEDYRSEISLSLKDMCKLKEHAEKGGKIELRVLDYVPPFGLFILDANSLNSRALVEVYSYKYDEVSEYGDIPKFYLTAKDNWNWYRFFRDQFKTLWNEGEDWPAC